MNVVLWQVARSLASRRGVSRQEATFRKAVALYLAISLGTVPLWVGAQSYDGVDAYEEYGKRINAAQEVAPVTDSVFGDKVSLYNGATTFEITDVTIPGNSAIPVEVGRQLPIDDQRMVPIGGGALRGFGDWSLDVPYVWGTFTEANGWTLGNAGTTNRCSNNTTTPNVLLPVPGTQGGLPKLAPLEQIWNGNELHIPGQGNQLLLANTEPKSYAYTNAAYTGSGVWKWVTAGNWRLRCVGSVTGMAGEGFQAVSPAGVVYTFNYALTVPTSPFEWAAPSGVGNQTIKPVKTPRVNVYLLATRVEDRFGNSVNYSYSSGRLTGITSNDGRSITLTWSGDSISSVTSALGTWNYSYATSSWTDDMGRTYTTPYLRTVTRPDGSRWNYTINGGSLITNKLDWAQDNGTLPPNHCQVENEGNGGNFQYTIGAPSGASATYWFSMSRHYRSYVPKGCLLSPDPNLRYPLDATTYFDVYTLDKKQVSGPALPTELWTYDYGSVGRAQYFRPDIPASDPRNRQQPYGPPGSCSTCAESKVVTVTGPVGITRYTYGIAYARNEGQLLKKEVADSNGNVLQATAYTYVSEAQAPSAAFPNIFGSDLRANYIDPMGYRNRPVAVTAIMQDGVTFSTAVSGFDALARGTGFIESSALGSRTTTTAHADNPWLWTLSQPLRQGINGTTTTETDYNANAQPVHTWHFGKLMATRSWNGDGTLASIADGNGHTTTLSSWKRGLPQTITFADGKNQKATVNDAGWITSVQDGTGSVTSYGYDPMGRLASVTYPADAGMTWNQTVLSFTPSGAGEYGTASGSWVQTVQTGNGVTRSWFDAFWRPLITEKYDAGNKPATVSQIVTRYDAGGRKVFESYPTNSVTSYTQSPPGTEFKYDALNRVTVTLQDWELNPQVGRLSTTTQYQTGFKTRVIDPRGFATTTSYQAFGEPDTSRPNRIEMPEGATTLIDRDAFGKPRSITRRGSYNGDALSFTRSFVYDANELPCKRVEPETGATLFAYDGANNLAWSAPGTGLGSQSCDRGSVSSSQMITRAYDARNRLTAIAYPDGISNTQYEYDDDGAMRSAAVGSGSDQVRTVYAYNKRRLLTAETLTAPGGKTFPIGYGYNANGHLGSLSYPDGRAVTFVPNALGQPTQAGSYATGVTYYPNGAIKQFNQGDGSVHVMTQNVRGLPERSRDSLGPTAVLDNISNYDENGNVAAITDGLPGHDGLPANVGNIDMAYDGLNRLTATISATFAGNGRANFAYDPLDNLRSASVGNGNQYSYAYDTVGPTNRLVSMTGSQRIDFAYDTRGNQVRKNAQAYTFDMADRVRAANGLESYLYDAAGRRVRKISAFGGDTTYYLYDKAGEMLHEATYSGAVTSDYVYLGGSLIAKITKGDPPPPPPPATPAWINVPGSSSDGTVTVSWASVGGATSYELQQKFNGGSWTHAYSGSATTKAFTGLANGTYVYQVQACNAGGCSAFATSTTLTVNVPQPPPIPAAINVPPSSSTGNVTISWSSSVGATSYELQQQFNGGNATRAYLGTATSTSLTGLPDGSYVYRVHACNAVGCSDWRTSGTLTMAFIPVPPGAINVPASSYSPAIPVSWSASPGATNYVLQESMNGGGWGMAWSGNATSTTVTVPDSGNYRFQVAACAVAGCSGFSASGTVAVTLPPATASSLSGPSSSTTGTFTLNWNPVAGATRYQLNQTVGGTLTTPYNAGGTSWTSSSLGKGTYSYQVFACNVAGCSPASNVLVVAVDPVPGAPASVKAPSFATVNVAFAVSWSAVSGATSYTLRKTREDTNNTVTIVYTGSATSTSVQSLPGIYWFAAQACNSAGCSAWTTAPNATEVQPKGSPLAVPASGSSSP